MALSANDVVGQLDETFLDTYFTVVRRQWAMLLGADEDRHLSTLNQSAILFTTAQYYALSLNSDTRGLKTQALEIHLFIL